MVLAEAGQSYSGASSIWIVGALVGVIMCARVARREKANTRAVSSLGLVFLAILFSSSITVMKSGNVPIPLSVTLVTGGIALLFVLAGLVLSIIGLTECQMHPERYEQGRSQAIWALVLSLLFMGGAALGIAGIWRTNRMRLPPTKVASQGVADFEEENCRYQMPGEHWMRMEGQLSEDYSPLLMLMRSRPTTIFMLHAGAGISNDFEVDPRFLLYNAVRGTLSEAKIVSEKEYTVDGVSGIAVTATGKLMGRMTAWHHWIGIHNGYLFQMVTHGPGRTPARIEKLGQEMMSGFSLIDRGRVASVSFDPFGAATSEWFHCRVDLSDTVWREWPGVVEQNPESVMGGGAVGDAGFLVTPFYYGGNAPELDELAAAFCDGLGVSYPSAPIRDLKKESGEGWAASSFAFDRVIDGVTYDYRMRVVRGGRRGYLLWAWQGNELNDLDGLAGQLFERIDLGPLDEEMDLSVLPDRLKVSHADFENRLGLQDFSSERYERALVRFKAAMELQPSNVTYAGNYLYSLSCLERYEAGLATIAELDASVREAPQTRAWEAFFLHARQKDEDALAIYEDLLAKGHRAVEDRDLHVRILAEADDWTGVGRVFAAYGSPSLAPDLAYARLLLGYGKSDEALAILKRNDPGPSEAPNSQVSLMMADALSGSGDHRGALEICEQLISNNCVTAAVYEKRADAEYGLEWYARAKTSIEQALKLAPSDELREYLRHVSGLLGEGNNSSIKAEIDPVPIPKDVLAMRPAFDVEAPDGGHAAFYLDDIGGTFFERGKPRKTSYYSRVRILTQAGISRFGTLKASFDPLAERLFVNKLCVYDRQGNVVWTGSASDYYVLDEASGAMATHDQVAHMPVSTLALGHTIELVYTIESKSDSDEFLFRRHFLASTNPTKLLCHFYTGDTKALKHQEYQGAAAERHGDLFIWSKRDLEPYQGEDYSPPVDDLLPNFVVGDSKASWKQEGEDYLASISERLNGTAKAASLGKQLAAGLNRAEKVNAILRHVQSEFTYKAIEFGRRARTPHSPDMTLGKRYGDCKDLAVLVRGMLSGVGIPAHLVLAHTTRAVCSDVPSLDQFNHMILMIPGREAGEFVDPTDMHADVTFSVPSGLAGRSVLILDPENIRLQVLPDYPPKSSSCQSKTVCRVDGDGPLRLQNTLELEGYYAEWMRAGLAAVDLPDRKGWLQGMFGGAQARRGTLLSCTVSNLYETSKPLIVGLDYAVEHGVDKAEDGSLALHAPLLWAEYYLDYAPMPERKLPFMLLYPFELRSEVVFETPKGTRFSTGTMSESGQADSLEWSCSRKATPAGARITLTARFRHGVYPVSEYEIHRQSAVAAIKAASRTLDCSSTRSSPPERNPGGAVTGRPGAPGGSGAPWNGK